MTFGSMSLYGRHLRAHQVSSYYFVRLHPGIPPLSSSSESDKTPPLPAILPLLGWYARLAGLLSVTYCTQALHNLNIFGGDTETCHLSSIGSHEFCMSHEVLHGYKTIVTPLFEKWCCSFGIKISSLENLTTYQL